MITLKSLGWNNFFINEFKIYINSGMIPGRISVEHKERYTVLTELGELQGEVSGKLIYTTDNPSAFPKTGDWVAGSFFKDEQKIIIHDVLKRKTKFSRKAAGGKSEEQVIAANVDYIFIVQSLDNNFSPRRLERYLSSAMDGKINPVIVLSKADLCNDQESKISEVKNLCGSVPVIAVSAELKSGIDELNNYIHEGETIAFVGSSGVGKSTLINLLTGRDIQKINAVREADSRGRHTTTRRELFVLPSGGILIDTPGMREFGLWSDGKGVEEVFDEIEILSEQCRFADCTHTNAKDCAVLSAVQSGLLSAERYNSYLKLQKELRYLDRKDDLKSILEEKRKWKIIHKEQKRFIKNNPGKF